MIKSKSEIRKRSGVNEKTISGIRNFYKIFIFDLDHTVYLGDAFLPTARETITTLREQGKRTLFLSNNPTRTREDYAAKLTRLGLPSPSPVLPALLI
jgi:ribonucleotide monophosphatase NagD (HAD superfamily)